MNSLRSMIAVSAITASTLIGSMAHAIVTTYTDRTSWQSTVGVSKTIDFSVDDLGNPITNPPSDSPFSSLTLKGVTFVNIRSYYNTFIYTTPSSIIHVDLPAGTNAVGIDLSSYQNVPGNYTVRLSSGEVYNPAAATTTSADFFGVSSTTPIQWMELSLNSSYLVMDNFSFVANAAQQVRIDIKPDTSDNLVNPVNPGSNGVIPVAIISTSTFDATKVNVSSLRFGHSGTEAPADTYSIKDSNGDGIPDLVVNFKTQMTGIICGDTSAKLTGQTSTGVQIFGSDFIKTTGCN